MPSIQTKILNGLPVEIDYSVSYGDYDINAIFFIPKRKERKTYFISDSMEKRITQNEWEKIYDECKMNEMESKYNYERELN